MKEELIIALKGFIILIWGVSSVMILCLLISAVFTVSFMEALYIVVCTIGVVVLSRAIGYIVGL